VIHLEVEFVLFAAEGNRYDLDIVYPHGHPCLDLSHVGEPKPMERIRHRRVEHRGLANFRNQNRDVLVEPQQGLKMTVIPMTMAATNRPQRRAQDIERSLRNAHRLPHDRIEQHRASLGLHQQRRMAEQCHAGASHP